MIVIRTNMDALPTSCKDCEYYFRNDYMARCKVLHVNLHGTKPPQCPLMKVRRPCLFNTWQRSTDCKDCGYSKAGKCLLGYSTKGEAYE